MFCCRQLGYAFATAIAAAALLCLAASQELGENIIDPRSFLLQPPGLSWIQLSWTPAWAKLPPIASPAFDYAEALHKAFIYLRIQRSGNITAPDHHIAWRSNSCITCQVLDIHVRMSKCRSVPDMSGRLAIKDCHGLCTAATPKARKTCELARLLCMQGPQGQDLTGGYYEAGGSYLKVGLPEAFPLTQLAWTITRHRTALYRVGLLDEALSALKWGTDYLVRPMTWCILRSFPNKTPFKVLTCKHAS